MSTRVREGEEERVTPLELFFDLIFVFAITQVTGLVVDDPTWAGLAKGLLVLGVLWWAWAAYAWLTNTVDPEEGQVRIAMVGAMSAMLVASLAVPDVFGDDALLFACAYAFVRLAHLGLYVIAGWGDRDLLAAVARLSAGTAVGVGLLFVAAGLDGKPQATVWAIALVATCSARTSAAAAAGGSPPVTSRSGTPDRDHRARRDDRRARARRHHRPQYRRHRRRRARSRDRLHPLVGVLRRRRDRRGAEAALDYRGRRSSTMARDSYSYLHLPMVAGIILFAVGVKKTMGDYADPLKLVPAVALCGGIALYLLAHVLFRLRNVGSLNRQRVVVAIILLALLPLAVEIPALATLTTVAALCVCLIAYEAIRFAEARDRVRHAAAEPVG